MSIKRKRPPAPPEKPPAQKADTIGQDASAEPDELDGLEPLQLRFIDLSASGTGMEEAARELGVCSRTLRRWKLRPQVASAIRNRTAESMALTRATLAASSNRAARALDELATDATPDHARISACKAIIENAAKLGELQEINDRLSELEAQLAKKGR
jgi:transposase-like protein